MVQYVVLTAVGPDRPGVVKELSSIIFGCGCNLEDSRMAVLAGEFALILLLSGSQGAIPTMQDRIRSKLEGDLHFHVSFKSTDPPDAADDNQRHRLDVSGSDQPGIVHRVSEAVASQGINVTSLESRVTRAAFTGTPIFSLHAELQIPSPRVLADLRGRLSHVCEQLDLAFTLERL